MSSVHQLYSVRHFNEIMLLGRECTKTLDHIKKFKSSHTKCDIILSMVISNLKTTDWCEFYGLNIIETMSLEFADYMFMVDELLEHTENIRRVSKPIKAELLAKFDKE